MEFNDALAALDSLAQETRLRLFRLLIGIGLPGMSAGDIARELHVPPNTLSFHLAQLTAAGLVAPRRKGRSIRYAIVPRNVRSLLAFLADDCCGGRPELCPPSMCAEDAGHSFVEDIFDDPRR